MILALLLAASAAAQPAGCPESYKDSYEADWNISRYEWEQDCRAGAKPKDILRARQKSFIEDCQAHFSDKTGDKIPSWNLPILCAQGAAGESQIVSQTGAPPRKRPQPGRAPAPKAASGSPIKRFYDLVEKHGLVSRVTPDVDGVPKGMRHKIWRRKVRGGSVAVTKPRSWCLFFSDVIEGDVTYRVDILDQSCAGAPDGLLVRWRGEERPASFTVDHLEALFSAASDELEAGLPR